MSNPTTDFIDLEFPETEFPKRTRVFACDKQTDAQQTAADDSFISNPFASSPTNLELERLKQENMQLRQEIAQLRAELQMRNYSQPQEIVRTDTTFIPRIPPPPPVRITQPFCGNFMHHEPFVVPSFPFSHTNITTTKFAGYNDISDGDIPESSR